MTDPRIDIRESLTLQLENTRTTRDRWWETYWQRRRVVVVPDETHSESLRNVDSVPHLRAAERVAESDLGCGKYDFKEIPHDMIRACIDRLKAARDKDSTNRNLSTLLAVVVKVQRDLEALLNGEVK